MTISSISEILMRERQRGLEEAAERYRQVRQHSIPRPGPIRAGAGRLLVRVGMRLGHLDPTGLRAGQLAPR